MSVVVRYVLEVELKDPYQEEDLVFTIDEVLGGAFQNALDEPPLSWSLDSYV